VPWATDARPPRTAERLLWLAVKGRGQGALTGQSPLSCEPLPGEQSVSPQHAAPNRPRESTRRLGVMSSQVVQTGDGWGLADGVTGAVADGLDLVATGIGGAEARDGITPSALIADPVDVAGMRKLRANGPGAYVLDPLAASPSAVHGVPMVSSPVTPAGTMWLGSPAAGCSAPVAGSRWPRLQRGRLAAQPDHLPGRGAGPARHRPTLPGHWSHDHSQLEGLLPCRLRAVSRPAVGTASNGTLSRIREAP
jgi:hypothetical protein